MSHPLLIVVAVLSIVASTQHARAQDPDVRQEREIDDVHLRNDCRLAAQVLTRGEPANKREWALGVIDLCDQSGPPVLASLWRSAPADSASIGRLIHRSVYLRDRRVYEVVSAIARDRSAPALKRAAALHLLGRWARPGFTLDYMQFFAPGFESASKNGIVYSGVSHDPQMEGAEPLPGSIRQDVLTLARDVAAADPDLRLRAAADILIGILD